MAKYSTISLSKEFYEILQRMIEEKPELGYNSVADFCKEAIRLHVQELKREIREDFWRKLNVDDLIKKISMMSACTDSICYDAFKAIKEMVFLTAGDFTIINGNELFATGIGYDRVEDLVNKHPSEFIAGWDKLEEKLKKFGYVRDFPTEIIRRDKKKLYVLITAHTIRDKYFFVCKDITFRKMMEDKLMKKLGVYEKIVKEIYDNIVIIQDGRIKFMTQSKAVTGYDETEVLDKRAESFFVEEERERIRKSMEEVMQGKIYDRPRRYKGLRKDGKVVEVEITSKVIEFEGKPAIMAMIKVVDRKNKNSGF